MEVSLTEKKTVLTWKLIYGIGKGLLILKKGKGGTEQESNVTASEPTAVYCIFFTYQYIIDKNM
jgi:hypothetical protein